MALSRRRFLGSLGAAAGTAAVVSVPLAERLLAVGEPRRLSALGGPIRLDANENAYGPSAEVMAAMREALGVANRYPDQQHEALLEYAAQYHKVAKDRLLAGCGSSDILRMAAAAFAGPGRKLAQASPTFEALGMYVEARGGQAVTVPLRGDFAHDLAGMLTRIDEPTTLIYICNPNNPTASLTPAAEIEAFLEKVPAHTTVLLDEAYHHFAVGAPGYASLVERAARSRGLIVSRTFSKVYGLAGLRIGYAVSAPETIERLSRYQLYDSLNAVGATCARVALANDAAMEEAARRNAADRSAFLKQAAARGVRTIPSCANFVMMDTGREVKGIIAHFRQNGIHVGRPFPPLDTYLRVSLGLPPEMQQFWKVWDGMKS